MHEQLPAPDLDLTLARLYDVFRRYPWPVRTPPCSHCVALGFIDPAAEAPLVRWPLRLLRAQDLRPYVRNAVTTWGTSDQYRYFLPRILELLATGQLDGLFGYVFSNLAFARWRTWPADEQQAIEAFLRAWWRWAIAHSGQVPCLDVLTAVGIVASDLSPFLDEWREDMTEAKLHSLVELVSYVLRKLERQGLSRPLFPWWRWKEQEGRTQQLLTWLYDPRTVEILEAAQPTWAEPLEFFWSLAFTTEELKQRRLRRPHSRGATE